MKKIVIFSIIICFFSLKCSAQNNCNNPYPVSVCPGVYLSNQTNAGMGDDDPSSCNIPGEDLVYEITVAGGASEIFVSIVNASGPLTLSLLTDSCANGPCIAQSLSAGSTNTFFNVSNATLYYLWVDAASTITYDIGIGAVTDSVYTNTSDTRGNLQLDSSGCETPSFSSAKPFFSVSYDDVYKFIPMTFSPLSVTGTLCISTFFENTTGNEGVKTFEFDFDTAGFSSVFASSFAGEYNKGTWIASNVGKNWTFTFSDSAGLGRGDFTGTPDSCLEYDFCFTILPVSNDTSKTNVKVKIAGDGYGAAFSGYVLEGCCPASYINCLTPGLSGASSGNAHNFSFSLNDPGGSSVLPIQLLDFSVNVADDKVILNWATASEINNNYFTILRSLNGYDWDSIATVMGAGNSTHLITYSYTDNKPYTGVSYYRLKQTDFNGASTYSSIIAIQIKGSNAVVVYPNPASKVLTIEAGADYAYEFTLYNVIGERMQVPAVVHSNVTSINTSGLTTGIYFLFIEQDNNIILKEKISIIN